MKCTAVGGGVHDGETGKLRESGERSLTDTGTVLNADDFWMNQL